MLFHKNPSHQSLIKLVNIKHAKCPQCLRSPVTNKTVTGQEKTCVSCHHFLHVIKQHYIIIHAGDQERWNDLKHFFKVSYHVNRVFPVVLKYDSNTLSGDPLCLHSRCLTHKCHFNCLQGSDEIRVTIKCKLSLDNLLI